MEPPEQAPIAPQECEAFAAVARRLAENVSLAVQIRPETLDQVLMALESVPCQLWRHPT